MSQESIHNMKRARLARFDGGETSAARPGSVAVAPRPSDKENIKLVSMKFDREDIRLFPTGLNAGDPNRGFGGYALQKAGHNIETSSMPEVARRARVFYSFRRAVSELPVPSGASLQIFEMITTAKEVVPVAVLQHGTQRTIIVQDSNLKRLDMRYNIQNEQLLDSIRNASPERFPQGVLLTHPDTVVGAIPANDEAIEEQARVSDGYFLREQLEENFDRRAARYNVTSNASIAALQFLEEAYEHRRPFSLLANMLPHLFVSDAQNVVQPLKIGQRVVYDREDLLFHSAALRLNDTVRSTDSTHTVSNDITSEHVDFYRNGNSVGVNENAKDYNAFPDLELHDFRQWLFPVTGLRFMGSFERSDSASDGRLSVADLGNPDSRIDGFVAGNSNLPGSRSMRNLGGDIHGFSGFNR